AAGRTQCRASTRAESSVTPHLGVHDRILAPDGVAGRAIPVDLGIEVILVETLRAITLVVGSNESGPIRQRNQILNLSGNRALAIHRNDISGERSAPGTVGCRAGSWVVDGVVCREVSASLICSGYRKQIAGALPLPNAFPAAEKEELVASNRTSRGSAINI